MKIFILLVLAFTTACQPNNAANNSQTPKPAQAAASATPTPAPSASPSSPKNGNYDGKGVVTKINLELVSVELDHEEIKGLMPRMIMEFYVKEKDELEKLKVGDKVDFVIEYKDGQEKIVSIKKAK